jgi:hypothetical protein
MSKTVDEPTFRKQAVLSRLGVLAQEPAVAKVVVALDKLDAVSSPQAQLVGTPGEKLVCKCVSAAGRWGVRHNGSTGEGKRTHYNEGIARPAALGVGSLRHAYSCSTRLGRSGVYVSSLRLVQVVHPRGSSRYRQARRAQWSDVWQ